MKPYDKAPARLAAKNHRIECVSPMARAAGRLTDTEAGPEQGRASEAKFSGTLLHTAVWVGFFVVVELVLGLISFYLIFNYFQIHFID